MKTIVIKLTFSGPNAGPFDILDSSGDVLLEGVSRENLINGITVEVDDDVQSIIIRSNGDCEFEKFVTLVDIPIDEYPGSYIFSRILQGVCGHT